jgi:hypothetical protein
MNKSFRLLKIAELALLFSVSFLTEAICEGREQPMVTKVFIFNQKSENASEPVKTLETPENLETFSKMWNAKKKTTTTAENAYVNFDYRLRVVIGSKNEIWLYNVSGATAILSKGVAPVYELSDVIIFNELIGVK